MNYWELSRRIERGLIEPLYLFSGEENYLKEEAIKKIKDIIVNPNLAEFNYEVLYGKDIDISTIINKAQTLPLMAKRRLMVIKDVEQLKHKENLISYLKNPLLTTCFIFIVKEIDRRNKFYSIFDEQKKVIFWPLFDNEMERWIRNKIKKAGKGITQEAILYLKEMMGNNLTILNNELEKIIIYTGEKSNIEEKDVEEVMGGEKENTIFSLIDTMMRKKQQESLKIFAYLFREGEAPTKILFHLAQQFKTLWRVKILLSKNYSSFQIRESLRIRKRYISTFIKGASLFSEKELKKIPHTLLLADLEIKTGKQPPQLILELLIINLCSSLYLS